jgi:predicted DNA-binding transcriptional regulator AlpA
MKNHESFSGLQKCHDDQIIGVEELAVLLNTTQKAVYKIHSESPKKLPPRLVVFGRKLCWRLGTCREWIRALEASQLGTIPKQPREGLARPDACSVDPNSLISQNIRIGRPRKAVI